MQTAPNGMHERPTATIFKHKLSQGKDSSVIEVIFGWRDEHFKETIVIVFCIHKCYMIKDLLQNKLFEPQTLLFRYLHFRV